MFLCVGLLGLGKLGDPGGEVWVGCAGGYRGDLCMDMCQAICRLQDGVLKKGLGLAARRRDHHQTHRCSSSLLSPTAPSEALDDHFNVSM